MLCGMCCGVICCGMLCTGSLCVPCFPVGGCPRLSITSYPALGPLPACRTSSRVDLSAVVCVVSCAVREGGGDIHEQPTSQRH